MSVYNFEKLLASLKFKIDKNATYFVANSNIKTKTYDIKKDALLLPTLITGSENRDVFLSVMYSVEDFNSIEDNEEGIVKLDFNSLASLLISGKLTAFYVDILKEDKEIKKLISELFEI